jgi:UDP:flavonoid glycosyltransferase YjiC (YdhE family)
VWTLGSAAVFDAGNFYEESVRAAKALKCRALFLVAENALDDLPDSMLAADYAPYSMVFPRAAAVVHQGGVGTTAQAMRAGVPQLIMPFSHDQPDNAARITRRGIGLSIKRNEYSCERVVPLLKALRQNPTYRSNTAEVAAQIAQENGTQTACDELERQLR